MGTRVLAGLHAATLTTLTLWTIAYLGRMPGIELPPQLLGPLLIAVIAGCGVIVGRGRSRREAAIHGAFSGVLAGLINLMAFGSLLSEPQGNGEVGSAGLLLVAGWIVACALLMASGAAIGGGGSRSEPRDAADWVAGLARLLVAAVFLLVIAGGIVTSTETGMAVPDWPRTFEMHMFLFPVSEMTGGVFFEHAHRLWGSLIGLLTIFLLVGVFGVDRRASVRLAAIGLLVFVIAQGILGGKRVVNNEIALALVHGVTGQIFLAMTAMMAACLGARWRSAETPRVTDGVQRKLAIAFAIVMTLQVGIGAVVRHLGVSSHSIMTHIALAVVILILAQVLGFRAMRLAGDFRPLRILGAMTAHTAGLMIVLGIIALWAVTSEHETSVVGVAVATAHQTLGGILMLAAGLQLVWSFRLSRLEPGAPFDEPSLLR